MHNRARKRGPYLPMAAACESDRVLAEAGIVRVCQAVCKGKDEYTQQRRDPAFIQHCLEVYHQQEGLCALTRTRITFDPILSPLTCLSLDRLDGKAGYLPGNVRLTTNWANKAAHFYGTEVFHMFIEGIQTTELQGPLPRSSAYHPRRPFSLSFDPRLANQRRTWGPYENIVYLCLAAKHTSKEKRRQLKAKAFVLHVLDLLSHQGMRCAISGIDMLYGAGNHEQQLSLVRKTNELPWEVGNVFRVCAWVANAFSHHGTPQSLDFVMQCKTGTPAQSSVE